MCKCVCVRELRQAEKNTGFLIKEIKGIMQILCVNYSQCY